MVLFFWETTQTLLPKQSIEFFISAIIFLFVLKAYFCFLSFKISPYSCFMAVISSVILESKSWFLPSCFFLFILIVSLFVLICFIICSLFSMLAISSDIWYSAVDVISVLPIPPAAVNVGC